MKFPASTLALLLVLFVLLNVGCDNQTSPATSVEQSEEPSNKVVAQIEKEANTKSESEHPLKSQDASDEASQLVRKEVLSFNDQIRSEDESKRLAALDALLPTKDHFIEIFGAEDGSRAAELLLPKLEELRRNSAMVKKEIERHGEVANVKVINVRDAEAQRYAAIPAKFPVYRVSIAYKNGDASRSSSYIVLEDDVVMIRGLEDIPSYLETTWSDDKP